MRRFVSKRELVRRLEALEALHARPTPAPLPGQETIPVAHIGHHTYEGPGHCRAEFFGETCGAHRDEHELISEDDPG
ncbi:MULTISPECIES: hypothetical protein [unclassified Streptomyces]|uniref:hypothetical protein n=1 Tax=unclassified Streptomyces TaxID=2593676 RepID=UPI0036EDBB0B